MPEMTSPDGSQTLTVPDKGLAAMLALGWHEVGTRTQSQQSQQEEEAKPRRSRSRRSAAEGSGDE